MTYRCAQRHVADFAAQQFSLRDALITSALVGMLKPERVADTVALAQYAIPDDAWNELLDVPFDMTEPQ